MSTDETTTTEQKPVVAKKASKNKVRFVILTNGQGGARIGALLKANLPNDPYMIAINTSDRDLERTKLPDAQCFKIGGENADGAGKNRNRAKMYFKKFTAPTADGKTMDAIQTIIGYYEEVFFHPSEQTIIISVFSSDGGTGSGLGPMLTASLTNYVNSVKSFHIGNNEFVIDDVTNEVPRPVVIGLTPRCSVASGATNLQNTIECFLDIQRTIDAGIGHFFIADNNLPEGVKYANTDEFYNIVNARIVAPFVKFFGVEMNSDIKCMDLQDKINTLRMSGCSAFTTVTNVNQFNYAVPKGQSVLRTVQMLRHDVDDLTAEENAAKALVKKLDIMSVDTTSVFFNVADSGITTDKVAQDLISASMIGFFGFKSLNAIVEDLRDNLHRTQVANDKKYNVVQEHSTGFTSVKSDAEELADKFGSKTMDQSSLLDLF